MQWKYLGHISEAVKSGCSGVYIITHKGLHSRVVYVGVSINVGRRVSEHYAGYLRGNRTIYNAGKNDDVYRLMSTYKIYNNINFYKKLANNFDIWASTSIYYDTPKNLLNKKQQFCERWNDILLEKYLPQLEVYALPLSNYTYELATKIESVIQTKLIKNFHLSGFFNVKHLSILGKIEHPSLTKVSVKIEPPAVDPASQIVLSQLDSSKTSFGSHKIFIDQIKDLIEIRNEHIKARVINKEERLSKYPNSGKPWTIEDNEKLRVLLVDFNLKPEEISKYIGRAPSTISKRIIRYDKLSGNYWRKNIKFL
ncbi:hypothetical protein AN214_04303 [Pseudoalteromonas sp. P1-9]|uniref:GIY-YIG nuclease family protein n=1 Tax=Pseudoalteromonas sp. P1-9 TaxID=1710354 RepID=UPI0006D605C0|nr:GIY-YIG nuclease family protein [Pseudoalteromonas sp. P1-9]KPV93657.1 hypothetical protein AN214_04303 [Pseudoalteromonas sp. P1-9]